MTQTIVMEFVSFKVSTDNDFCHCCGAPIKYVVTLSDGNLYGMDCAKKLIPGRVVDYAAKEYFNKNNPTFKIGIRHGSKVVSFGTFSAKSESAAIKQAHRCYNNNKNLAIFSGSRCLYRGKTINTPYETTIDRFVIL